MARLELIEELSGHTAVIVTLSRRNLLALLHKLDMPDSAQTISNKDIFVNGEQAEYDDYTLVIHSEPDDKHYAKRALGPGVMHEETERFVQEHGGAPGEVLFLGFRLSDNTPL